MAEKIELPLTVHVNVAPQEASPGTEWVLACRGFSGYNSEIHDEIMCWSAGKRGLIQSIATTEGQGREYRHVEIWYWREETKKHIKLMSK